MIEAHDATGGGQISDDEKETAQRGAISPAMLALIQGAPTQAPAKQQIQVFVDGSNDYYKNQGPEPLTLWRTSVHQDADATPGTWHWPEYVPAKS
jgi:hypothetical protein